MKISEEVLKTVSPSDFRVMEKVNGGDDFTVRMKSEAGVVKVWLEEREMGRGDDELDCRGMTSSGTSHLWLSASVILILRRSFVSKLEENGISK